MKFEPLFFSENHTLAKDLLFVVTFDEGSGGTPHEPSHIATILVGGNVVSSAISSKYYTHYSLLRLVEDTFGLDSLNQNDKTAEMIDGIWK